MLTDIEVRLLTDNSDALDEAARIDIKNIWGMEMESLPEACIQTLLKDLLTRHTSTYRASVRMLLGTTDYYSRLEPLFEPVTARKVIKVLAKAGA